MVPDADRPYPEMVGPSTLEEHLVAQRRANLGGPASWNELVALALSGGGIRSATFSLGVLQAIAKARNDDKPGPG